MGGHELNNIAIARLAAKLQRFFADTSPAERDLLTRALERMVFREGSENSGTEPPPRESEGCADAGC